jgi:hypothetical protein
MVLPLFLEHCTICISHMVAIVIVTVIIIPWSLVAVAPLAVGYTMLQTYYRRSARELKRLQGEAQSPVVALLSEGLQVQEH